MSYTVIRFFCMPHATSEESTSGLRLIAQRSGVRSPSLEVMTLVGLLISTPASGTCIWESFSPKSLLVRSRKGALTGRISERTFSLDLDGEVGVKGVSSFSTIRGRCFVGAVCRESVLGFGRDSLDSFDSRDSLATRVGFVQTRGLLFRVSAGAVPVPRRSAKRYSRTFSWRRYRLWDMQLSHGLAKWGDTQTYLSWWSCIIMYHHVSCSRPPLWSAVPVPWWVPAVALGVAHWAVKLVASARTAPETTKKTRNS